MTQARDEMVGRLWHGRDPFVDLPRHLLPIDHQGWNSDHPFLCRAIDERLPRVVVEIGVWKGGSVKTLAGRMKEKNVDGVVIAIDTWLGSSEHWCDGAAHERMIYKNGFPQALYYTFVGNLLDKGLQDYVLPLPLDSVNAFQVLARLGIRPDVIHIDAGHDYESVIGDLTAWWPLLKEGGILIGDDYMSDGSNWVDVKRAFDDYFAAHAPVSFEASSPKCYVVKAS